MISYGSDCSGIEAPYIALTNIFEKKNIEHKFASDNNKYVQESIKANYDPEQLDGDIFLVNMSKRPHVDVYTAGFPCQTFSTVGQREGFNDDRGIVFFAVYDYIKAKLPKICLLENVKGLVNHNGGKTFETIISMLEKLGKYNVYHEVISPHECGWPQHRSRVFIVCIDKRIQTKKFKFPQAETLQILASDLLSSTGKIKSDKHLTPFNKKNLKIHIENVKRKYNKDIQKDYYFTDLGASAAFGKPMHQLIPCLKASRSKYYITNLNRFLTLDEVERIQGFPPLNVVVSESQYLKQLGNSMCVPLVEKIFMEIFSSIS